jgi:hypothetical protein
MVLRDDAQIDKSCYAGFRLIHQRDIRNQTKFTNHFTGVKTMKAHNSPSLALRKTADETIAMIIKLGNVQQTTLQQPLSSEMMACLTSAKAVPTMPSKTIFGDEDQSSEISMRDWGWG